MGNGCLKPTPRTGQIYIDCINKIYQEVKTMQYNQEKKSIDMYVVIKQLLQKKGWLRKLMDNLTSHRQSISQAALHNFRLMTQTKGKQYKVTGLVIIDYIITGVHRQSGLDMSDKYGDMVLKMIKDRDSNAISQYQDSQQNNNMKFKKPQQGGNISKSLKYLQQQVNNLNEASNSQNNHQSNTISTNLLSPTNNNSNNTPPTPTTNNTLLFRQIYNVKFSNIFYNMLHSLISTEDTIYSSGINSIISYTRYHNVKNIQQEKITQLMQILLEHIQTGEEVNHSLKAYEMLLKKLRQTFLQNQIKHFKVFLKIWQHSFQQMHNQQIDNIHTHLQNKLLLESIIHEMIVSMIGSVGINKIYEQIILVYDQHRFEGMQHFEQMLLGITKKDQLKKQFYRGLYSFLLSYLAVCKCETQQGIKSTKQYHAQLLTNNLNNFSLQKWACIHSSKTYQSFISQYQNIGQQRVKKQVIQTLKRWSREYEFVEINEIIKYNSQLVLNSFLFNVHECFVGNKSNDGVNANVSRKNPPTVITTASNPTKPTITPTTPTSLQQFAHYLSQQFCTQFCHHANLQQRIAIVNLLYDEVKSGGGDIGDVQSVLYLEMIEKLLYEEQLEETGKSIDWCQVDVGYGSDVNVKLIAVVIYIVSKSTQKMLTKQLDHLAYFMYSLFEFLTKTTSPHLQIIQTLTTSIQLIQTIQKSNGPMIILSFTQRMIKAVTNDMNRINFYYTWDFILNCVYILLMSPRNFNRGEEMKRHLSNVYSQLTANEQLKEKVLKLTQQEIEQNIDKILVDTFGQLDDNQIQRQFIKMHLPKPQDFENHHHLTGSHQKIYELSSIAFRDMFSRGVSKAKGGFMPQLQQQPSFTEQNGCSFSRVHSIIHEDELHHEQRSIADVMDMINY